ncbi:MAG: hypothetical protein FWB72_05225 [Firmicutes bacterium]|nr:hypothetical protein [Bacillota bacterium]
MKPEKLLEIEKERKQPLEERVKVERDKSRITKEQRQELEELQQKNNRIIEIEWELSKLTQDFAQAEAGLEIPDLSERKAKFRELHTEIRELVGKQPRNKKDIS